MNLYSATLHSDPIIRDAEEYYDIFYAVRIRLVRHPDSPWERSYANPLNSSLKKVMNYLNIPEIPSLWVVATKLFEYL